MISRRTRQHQVFDAAVAVALPLAILGGALALIAIENSLVVVGPLDRAVWGWLTIPLAWAAPVIAGAWWARLSPRTAGIVTFAVIAGCAGVTLASLTTQIGCQPVTSLDALPRMLTVGVVYGAGVALTAAVAASAVRRLEAWWTRGLALLGCAVVSVIVFFASLLAWASVSIVGVSCGGSPLPA